MGNEHQKAVMILKWGTTLMAIIYVAHFVYQLIIARAIMEVINGK